MWRPWSLSKACGFMFGMVFCFYFICLKDKFYKNIFQLLINWTYNVFRDIGGQDKLRGIWKFYIKNCEGLFYVVDSSDRERINLARNELYSLLDFEDMQKIPVIIIANKQDISTSMTLQEIERYMRLNEIKNPYHLYGTCATTGEGLFKAFGHMTEIIKENRGLTWANDLCLYLL